MRGAAASAPVGNAARPARKASGARRARGERRDGRRAGIVQPPVIESGASVGGAARGVREEEDDIPPARGFSTERGAQEAVEAWCKLPAPWRTRTLRRDRPSRTASGRSGGRRRTSPRTAASSKGRTRAPP